MRLSIDILHGWFSTMILLVCINVEGQSVDRCVPDHLSDTLSVNRYYNHAQYLFNGHDFLEAATCFHEVEKILPNCSEIRECLASCYWEYYQYSVTYDVKYMLLAKNYLDLCVHDKSIPLEYREKYQNCLNEISGILKTILVEKYYADGRYYGEMLADKRDGFGIFYYNNGMRYEGYWIDGKKEDLDGKLFDSNNKLIYKGAFIDDEKYDNRGTSLLSEIKYWETIKDSSDTTAYLQYLNRFSETGLYNEEARKKIDSLRMPNRSNIMAISDVNKFNDTIVDYIQNARDKIGNDKFERNFFDVTHSLSGYYSMRAGVMHPSRWGYYGGFGVKGDVIHNGIGGIRSMRYTVGALYAPTNWMYVYAGGGLAIDSLKANNKYNTTAELGVQFRLGVVSLSTGIQVAGIIHKPSLDYSFGVGFNFAAYRKLYPPFTYYVFSPMAPCGIMSAWYKGGISGYLKLQTPLFGDIIRKHIAPTNEGNHVRYSFTAGTTMTLSKWFSFYTGIGPGVYKDSINDINNLVGLDAEIGLSIRIMDEVSLTAGLHGVNMTDRNRFLTYDVGIGINTWKVFLKRANHSVWEYSFSETAKVGVMNGFIYEFYGGYCRIQLSNLFKNNQQNYSSKWNGERYSFTFGPMIALTDWLFIHGGIGTGLYKKEGASKATDLGFETELGVSVRAWLVNVSFGPHWCRIGKDDSFLDYNMGIGVNVPIWFGNSHFGNYGSPFVRLRYSGGARLGIDGGVCSDVVGFYVGVSEALPEPRMNFYAGGILTPSALMHFSLGAGFGIYADGIDPSIGFDLEAMYTVIIWKLPLTIGIKLCRVGSSKMFIEPIYGFGGFV